MNEYQPKDGILSYYSQAFNIIVEKITVPQAYATAYYQMKVIKNSNQEVLEIVNEVTELNVWDVREALKFKYLLSL